MQKLTLNKQKITELSSKEMENIEGGRGAWSNFRTGSCKYSDANPVRECILVPNNAGGFYESEATVGCVKS